MKNMVTLKGKQKKPGQPVDKVVIQVENADLFLDIGYKLETKEDEEVYQGYLEFRKMSAKNAGFAPLENIK